MVNFLWKNKNTLIGAIVGTVAGYLYWYYVGCASGSCPITANWGASTAYGAFMGASILSFFEKKESQKEG